METTHQEMESNNPLLPTPSSTDVVPEGESNAQPPSPSSPTRLSPPSPPPPLPLPPPPPPLPLPPPPPPPPLLPSSIYTPHEVAVPATPQHQPVQNYQVQVPEDCRLLEELFKKQIQQKEREDLRNTIVVVAVLILTMTYQTALSPPGGTWQEDPGPSNVFMKGKHVAGTPVLRDKEPMVLLIYCFLNKMAFFAAMLIIWVCMFNEVSKAVRICKVLVIAAVFMMVTTYITGTLLIAGESSKFTTIEEAFIHVLAFAVVFTIFWLTDFITGKFFKSSDSGYGSGWVRVHNEPDLRQQDVDPNQS